MVRAVIFDIDNTLYSYDKSHPVAWDALCQYVDAHLGMDRETFARCHRQASEIMKQRLGISCGSLHNRLLRYQIILEENGLDISHALPMSKLYWNTLMDDMEPEPGLLDCLKTLKMKGCILGIGTDMTIDYQLEKLERMGIVSDFKFVVSSEEVAAEKPSQKLFACCAEKAGVPACECLYVGDSLKKDVIGATQAGMQAVWYCPDKDKAKEYPGYQYITHFSQLPGLLAE